MPAPLKNTARIIKIFDATICPAQNGEITHVKLGEIPLPVSFLVAFFIDWDKCNADKEKLKKLVKIIFLTFFLYLSKQINL